MCIRDGTSASDTNRPILTPSPPLVSKHVTNRGLDIHNIAVNFGNSCFYTVVVDSGDGSVRIY